MKFDDYLIRPLVTTDLVPYFNLVEKNRRRLENFFTGTVSRTATLEDTRNFLLDIEKKVQERQYFPYIIIDEKQEKIIGFLDLKNIDWNIPKSEVGCWMDEDFAGKGIATKAFEMFCAYCFKEYGFLKLFLRTHPTNKAARYVAESCGFEVEGIIRRDYKTTSGEIVDLVYYGKLSG